MNNDCKENELTNYRMDVRLKNWQKWIKIRKKFQEKMFSINKRTPIEQLINSPISYRLKIEDKLILEYAKIPTTFYSNRGCPDFWELPLPASKHPDLLSQMPKIKKCTHPEMEYVGLPDYIKKYELDINDEYVH